MNYSALMHRIAASQPATSRGLAPMSRRRFVKVLGVSGLALGAAPALGASDASAPAAPGLKPSQQPDQFVHIAPDGTVTVQINRLEFGQVRNRPVSKFQGQFSVAFEHAGHAATMLLGIVDTDTVAVENIYHCPGNVGEQVTGGTAGKIGDLAGM